MPMQLSSEVDVAIIGAGAAGLGAYCALADHGLSVIILEARDRIGGRALTRYLPEGIVFDAGCEWLHSQPASNTIPSGKYLVSARPPMRSLASRMMTDRP